MRILTSLRQYIGTLVHPGARKDVLTAARHRAFIAPRLLGSLGALAALPLYLAARGMPSLIEIAVFGWLTMPIMLAYFLSRTGRYEAAHVLSALSLTGLVTAVAGATGGIGSFASVWLVVVPLEAALFASFRTAALASLFTLAGAAALLAASGLLPPSAAAPDTLVALVMISAALYLIALALSAQSLAGAGVKLLSAEEDRYELLARNISDAITRHGANGAVLFASPAAEPLLGTSCGALLGHGLFDRVHLHDRPAYLAALADAANLGQARSVEFRVRRENSAAHFVWVEMRCRPLERADGREVVAVLRDVSARKTQEQSLEDARAEAERANAGKNRFLATMSHELRTPLNAIIGFSDMLTNDTITLDGARRDEYAKLINDSGRHLLSVVNGILDMSKMETGNFEITSEPFAPGQVIAGCGNLLALKAREAGVDLSVRVPAGLPEIVADRRALSQILINLISNAIKFTDHGGKVAVAAARDGHHLAITVEDTGVGIGEDDLPRLGEAFFQARASYDRRHDGTGLGLSIVKGLVRLHGGSFDVRSQLGEGTLVTVRLPIDCEGKRPQAETVVFERRSAPPRAAAEIALKKIA